MSNQKFPSKVKSTVRELVVVAGKFVVSGTTTPSVISNDGPTTAVSASIISTGAITLNLGTNYPKLITAQVDVWTSARSNYRFQLVSESVATDGKVNFQVISGTSIAAVAFPANSIHTCSYEILVKNAKN